MASFNDFVTTNFPGAVIIQDGYNVSQSRGEEFSLTESGSPRIRRMFPNSWFEFTVQVAGIPQLDMALARSAYDTPGTIDTLVDPATGVTYSVTWMAPPTLSALAGSFAVMEFRFYGAVQ